MAAVTQRKNGFSVNAYQGDFKTLLGFNFASQAQAANLAGFSIQVQPPGGQSYYLLNDLSFPPASGPHAVLAGQPAQSSANVPFQKYRWVHVPGQSHQGLAPATGRYAYTVTPRFFNAGKLTALDPSRSVSVTIDVAPFVKGHLALGFTRGYMQSQAFAHHFGDHTPLQPPNRPLVYNTAATAGSNQAGQSFTFAQIYQWAGSTARVQVFNVLNQVLNDPSLSLKMFAYDLDEPDIVTILLKLAAEGRIRLILDNAELHVTHTVKNKKTGAEKTVTPLEVPFAQQFQQQAKPPNSAIVRGQFARYSHDKILVVCKNGNPISILTGSTNFSVTGLYVNANHVLVFNDPTVAKKYSDVFEESWNILSAHSSKSTVAANAFATSTLATTPFQPQSNGVPPMTVTFSPHTKNDVQTVLGAIVNRIKSETNAQKGSVLFAVMEMDDTRSANTVYKELNTIHSETSLFSYGISDRPDGIYLYQPGSSRGVLVTGKPSNVQLPPPFDQVPSPPGHEIHDKFVVCGFNGPDPVVWCGSSNLAEGGEAQNGDNLLQIHDPDVATAFAIEALLLIDHYNFLDRYAKAKETSGAASAPRRATPKASKRIPKQSAVARRSPAKKAARKSRARHAAPTRKSAPKKASGSAARAKRPAKKSATKLEKKAAAGRKK